MNIYKHKRRWKLVLFFSAIFIGALSLWYTNFLMNKLSIEERKRIELWAEATQKLINSNHDDDISFLFEVQRSNETIPVILLDNNDNIISFRNLDSVKMSDKKYQSRILDKFKKNGKESFIITTDTGEELNRIYYNDSFLLKQLQYYPYVQLGIITLFIIVSYFAFSVARKTEQNKVWLGMSKETAHQLGTPISSLMAWIEVMKMNYSDEKLIEEISKDIHRLEKIADRFSKIGSKPMLDKTDVSSIIKHTVNYIKARSPQSVEFDINDELIDNNNIPLNVELFEWVVENLCKNSIDAMSGEGNLKIHIFEFHRKIIIDFSDTGKGIPKSKFNAIFQPGYTTKSRGWGLGLSLSKRIVEQYHKGKILVKHSEIGTGTTIRVLLPKS